MKYCEGFPACPYQNYNEEGHLICENPQLCPGQTDKPKAGDKVE